MDKSEMNKLEPCPFCGDDYYLRTVYYDYGDDAISWLTDKYPDDRDVREMADEIMHCRVICMDCAASVNSFTVSDLVAKWNRRANR